MKEKYTPYVDVAGVRPGSAHCVASILQTNMSTNFFVSLKNVEVNTPPKLRQIDT